MAKFISDNVNFSNVGNDLSPISVGSATAVKLLDAFTLPGDIPPINIFVYNSGNRICWIKSQAAAVDNLKQGVPVFPGERLIIYTHDKLYTGEISAIMDSGGARDVFVSWI